MFVIIMNYHVLSILPRYTTIAYLSIKMGEGVNPWQPKVFGVKFSLREIERIFSIKIRNLASLKMPK